MKAELEQQRQHAESAEQVIREGDLLVIDGSHGEGGGQILRTALTLSALTGKAMSINIRAHRARPGLAAQHLTAVRSVARVCRARVSGDELDSQSLTFVPQDRPIAGTYTFDVASARKCGSAGSAPLILQTVLLPLARASGPSAVTIDGGTHLPLVWDELYPFADRRALHAASDLGLGNDAQTLARLVDPPKFARLVAALVRCELGKHAAEILAEADVTRTEAG